MPHGMEVILVPADIVLEGSLLSLKGAQPPNFRPMSVVAKMAGSTKMPLGMEVGLGRDDFVFDGDPDPLRKKGTAPTQFLAHVYCGQAAGWIKMPLGTEVNLGPGDVALDKVAALLSP